MTQLIALNWLLAEPILFSLFGGRKTIETIGSVLVVISLIMTVWSFMTYYQATKGLLKGASST